jgi:hypothetical protein
MTDSTPGRDSDGISPLCHCVQTDSGTTQPPNQWVPRVLCLGAKRPDHEADHLPTSGAEVRIAWSYISTPSYVFMVWYLVKHGDNFTFILLLYELLVNTPNCLTFTLHFAQSPYSFLLCKILLHSVLRFSPSLTFLLGDLKQYCNSKVIYVPNL